MINGPKCIAILLSAGTGSRMGGPVAKQYMLIKDKPVLWYSLNVIEESQVIDECILVTGENDIEFVKSEILGKYGFTKVSAVVSGGSERYLSVLNGLRSIEEREGYVFIHDGARPFLTEKILKDTYQTVREHRACVAAVPSKDTIKISDASGFVSSTPSRRFVWSIQTPQVFETGMIQDAYEALAQYLESHPATDIAITDDAGVVEFFGDCRVKLVEAAYTNIKITTPEDISMAESFLCGDGNVVV